MPRPPQSSGRPGTSLAGKTEKRLVLNTARLAAIKVLNGVMTEQKQLSEMTQTDEFKGLAPEDRARTQRLATHTLRHVGRADRALRPHLAKLPAVEVLNILRLGVVEIVGLGAPAHAVVNDLVSICASTGQTRPYKGLVNAVLRKAVADVTGKWDKSPVQMLPKWLRNPLREAYGNGTIMAMETAHMRGAQVDLTVTADPQAWAESLGGTVLPNGSVRLDHMGQISALAGFDDGKWWVQDAAASWPAAWLALKSGETVLDVCAAPGGKTMQMALSGAEVTALDISAKRMERVAENLTRTKLEADLVVANVLDWQDARQFDAVLLDAPCSATGTIRRHPDLPFAKDGTGITELIRLQAEMLSAAAKRVRPGGRLVFCTCSLIPDEGEVHAENFLDAHKDFVVDTMVPEGMEPEWRTQEGGYRLRPDYWADRGGMDGFYIIRMNRTT
ncbi:MAG TPA: 16S rRNA methyltransferase [Rhodobacteraceae bacterium]|jgi:16S rRNA (cytosine967-C5)-methyltransferase|nr:16S rRNA methyltransferase [Paracoccaceae bacterium]|tara:strand:+ start:17410 stop:18744 length:1335 start_codon:yes stop_codon:yes gene_type:complete